mmetsp:Transcript_26557/g.91429  ORF Transcript_26557/g.91429 Transcript_26557/m.91429 type:complete len:222 (+) Transcript_26557:1434-2099(+)
MCVSTRRLRWFSGPCVSSASLREPPWPTAVTRSRASEPRLPPAGEISQSRTDSARAREKPMAPPRPKPNSLRHVAFGQSDEPSHSAPHFELVCPSRRTHNPALRRSVPARSDSIGNDRSLMAARLPSNSMGSLNQMRFAPASSATERGGRAPRAGGGGGGLRNGAAPAAGGGATAGDSSNVPRPKFGESGTSTAPRQLGESGPPAGDAGGAARVPWSKAHA